MSEKVIYSMVRVGRTYPPNNKVLRDISLGFYYGAKIGVLGLNGAGKTTLLRIMAGVEDDYEGETFLADGYTAAIWSRSRNSTTARPCARSSKRACRRVVDTLREFDEINGRFGEELSARRDGRADDAPGRSPGQTRRHRCLGSGQPPGAGDGCAALPAGRRLCGHPLRR